MSSDQRMEWWRNARIGMFIHWGPYAALKGDCRGYRIPFPAEWSRHALRIPDREYHALAEHWNPFRFNADSWVALAREAGMKYLVFTAKHHDGFNMFDAANSRFKITNTPFGRDVCAELSAACDRGGVRFGLYYSPRDWDHPDYPQKYVRRSEPGKRYGGWYSCGENPEGECGCWGCKAGLPLESTHLDGHYTRYVRYLYEHVMQLIRSYPNLSILWFDGQDHSPEEARTDELLAAIRAANPAIIVNDRIGYTGYKADFGVAEQFVPETGQVRDWETCMTIPRWSWGYDPDADTAHTPGDIIRKMVDAVSKGGNFLLNVSPDDLGEIPVYQRERLSELGRWLRRFGDAVYGTERAGIDMERSDIRFTRKGETLYLIQLEHPGRDLRIPGMELPEGSEIILADGSRPVRWENSPEGLHLRIGELPLALWKSEEALAYKIERKS